MADAHHLTRFTVQTCEAAHAVTLDAALRHIFHGG
jgi:hypothetical protein